MGRAARAVAIARRMEITVEDRFPSGYAVLCCTNGSERSRCPAAVRLVGFRQSHSAYRFERGSASPSVRTTRHDSSYLQGSLRTHSGCHLFRRDLVCTSCSEWLHTGTRCDTGAVQTVYFSNAHCFLCRPCLCAESALESSVNTVRGASDEPQSAPKHGWYSLIQKRLRRNRSPAGYVLSPRPVGRLVHTLFLFLRVVNLFNFYLSPPSLPAPVNARQAPQHLRLRGRSGFALHTVTGLHRPELSILLYGRHLPPAHHCLGLRIGALTLFHRVRGQASPVTARGSHAR